MDEIYLVESGVIKGSTEIENLWETVEDAESYAFAKMSQSGDDYKRDSSKENADTLRYWAYKDQFLCIKVKTV